MAFCVLLKMILFSRDRTIDSPTKQTYQILSNVIASLNASGNFSVEKTWGYFNATTKTFDGMNGRVIRKEADIAGTRIAQLRSFVCIEEEETLF